MYFDERMLKRYEPKTFADLVFVDDVVREKLEGYVNGYKNRWVILWGAPGSGKSATANVVANAMNNHAETIFKVDTANVINAADWEAKTPESIVNWFFSGSPTIVFDELAHLNEPQQAKLRGIWDKWAHCGNIIFTMNHHPSEHVIDALIDRCEVFHIERPSVEQALPVARRMFSDAGLTNYSDSQIQALLSTKTKVAYERDGSVSKTRRITWRDVQTIVGDERQYNRTKPKNKSVKKTELKVVKK